MALGMRNKDGAGHTELRGQLDFILDFMTSDDLTATVAGSVTSAAAERPAAEYRRELPRTHTFADEGSQLLLVHSPKSFHIVRDLEAGNPSCGFALHNTHF